MIDRQKEINEQRSKAHFNTIENINDKHTPVDFSKIRIGVKTLDDAILSLG